jgi:hypothetical protein
VRLAAGSRHAAGITAAKQALATGDNSLGQCDVCDRRDIVGVAAVGTMLRAW